MLELLNFIAKDTETSMVYVGYDLGAIAQGVIELLLCIQEKSF